MPVLRTAGIVRSERGPAGGYRLNMTPGGDHARARRPRRLRGQLAPIRGRNLVPLGLGAGFVDTTRRWRVGGARGHADDPRHRAVRAAQGDRLGGDAERIPVALAASAGFPLALGSQGVAWTYVGALLIGRVIAAPARGVACSPRRLRGSLARRWWADPRDERADDLRHLRSRRRRPQSGVSRLGHGVGRSGGHRRSPLAPGGRAAPQQRSARTGDRADELVAQASVANGVQPPLARNALELSRPEVGELDTGSRDEVLHRAGDDDGPRLRFAGHSRPDADGDSRELRVM